MIKGIVFMHLLGLFCFSPAPEAFVQTNGAALKISISMENTRITRAGTSKARLKVENQTGQKTTVGNAWVSIRLSKSEDDSTDCRKDDCFIAHVPLASRIKSGESFESDTDLASLYWHDLIHSGVDLSEPKNLFTAVPPGKYYLFVEFQFEKGLTTEGRPQTGSIKSNKIYVALTRES